MKCFKILWLGFSVPESVIRDIFVVDPLPAVQTHRFGWSFARALRHAFGDVTLASTPPVQTYPLVPRLIFRGGIFKSQGIHGVMLGFVNIIALKHLTRFFACCISLSGSVFRKRLDWIFIHGVHTPFLVFGLLARLSGCRVAVVLTDPPGVMMPTDGSLARSLKTFDAWVIERLLAHVDAVIALAPELVHRFAPGRPALVFPGVLESTLDFSKAEAISRKVAVDTAKPFTIVYAGGLSAAYGVDRLVNAVCKMDPGISVQLKLFGRGDQEGYVRQLATTDSRIVYGGFIDPVSLVPILYDADLLVNPRPTSEFFASMSFPSKLIEYLSTGRPVLTTRIKSIPEDLVPHFLYIIDESPDGIRAAILNVMELPDVVRDNYGKEAMIYVRSQYSEEMTGHKIARFIDELVVENLHK